MVVTLIGLSTLDTHAEIFVVLPKPRIIRKTFVNVRSRKEYIIPLYFFPKCFQNALLFSYIYIKKKHELFT